MKITIADLYRIMDLELEKPENEMNTDLIDLCSSIICKHLGITFDDKPPMFKPWEAEEARTEASPHS